MDTFFGMKRSFTDEEIKAIAEAVVKGLVAK